MMPRNLERWVDVPFGGIRIDGVFNSEWLLNMMGVFKIRGSF